MSAKDERVVKIKIHRGFVGMMAANTIYIPFHVTFDARSMTIARSL